MSQSLSAVYIHAIFSTKNRMPFFQDANYREEMHAYLGGVSKKLECPPIIVGGTTDHVHILARLSRKVAQSEWIKEIKRTSALWIKKTMSDNGEFSWQAGYGTFSVSASNLKKVRTYIAGQEEHHRKITFQEEYREFLRRYGVEWDEKYVWD